ncbi:MAG TPA: hypothetical protein VFQ68_13380 [Streptosporangiaceae bacterium]|nr:hypothetical protein [Streptosporangiaceae bacterium]
MPTLYRQLKKLPWAAVPAISDVSTGHGRRARRTIKAVVAPAWTGFDGAAQVAQLRRTVTKDGKKTVEVVYLITSDRDASPAALAAWVRGHREIENRLHGSGTSLTRRTNPWSGQETRLCHRTAEDVDIRRGCFHAGGSVSGRYGMRAERAWCQVAGLRATSSPGRACRAGW